MPGQPYAICAAGGFVTLGTMASPDSIFDGIGVESAALAQSTTQMQAAGIGDQYVQTDVLTVSYRITITILVPKSNTGGLFAAGLACYATYKAQGTTGTAIFAGPCAVTSVSDAQNYGQYYKQTIELTSTGEPDTAPVVAVP